MIAELSGRPGGAAQSGARFHNVILVDFTSTARSSFPTTFPIVEPNGKSIDGERAVTLALFFKRDRMTFRWGLQC